VETGRELGQGAGKSLQRFGETQSGFTAFEVAAQARRPELPLIEIPVTVYLQEHYLRRDFRK
jgi:hypothetical protein